MDWQTALVVCVGILLVAVVVWQVFATGRTAVVHGAGKENEEVLEEIRHALAELTAAQRELTENVTEVRTRVTAIEKLLREVG